MKSGLEWFTVLLLFLPLMALSGCHRGSSSGSSGSEVGTEVGPSGLSYPDNPVQFIVGQPVSGKAPSLAGGAATEFAVAPDLPPGLVLNPTTGVISGLPTAARATADYVITATGQGGSDSFVLTITIVIEAPTALAYSDSDPIYTAAVPITPNVPVVSGGPVLSYEIDPMLPAGLSLSSVDGVIDGTPTSEQAATDYQVTGTGPGGSVTAVLTITVLPEPPVVDYGGVVVFCEGISDFIDPVLSGGTPDSFTIVPSLPAGLALDPGSGRIFGTPSALFAASSFQVTASNPGGQAMTQFQLAIEPVSCPLDYPEPDRVLIPTVSVDWSPVTDCISLGSFMATPPLPSGLLLDPDSGRITGAPTVDSPLAEYTVSADGECGPTSTTIQIRVSPRYTVSTPDANGSFDSTTGVGTLIQPITVIEDPLNPGFPHALNGFVLIVGHDPALLNPQSGGTLGTDVALLNGGLGPDFFGFQIGSSSVVVSAIFSVSGADALVADLERSLATVQYSTVVGSFVGQMNPIVSMLSFLPAASFDSSVVLDVTAEGVSTEPVVENGQWTLTPVP